MKYFFIISGFLTQTSHPVRYHTLYSVIHNLKVRVDSIVRRTQWTYQKNQIITIIFLSTVPYNQIKKNFETFTYIYLRSRPIFIIESQFTVARFKTTNKCIIKASSDDLLCFFTFNRETSIRRRCFSKPKPTFLSICTRRSQIIGCLDCAWNIHRKRGGTKKFSEYKLIRIGSIIWRISLNASHSGNWLFLASEVNSSRTVSSKRLFKILLVSWRRFFRCSKIVFGVHVPAEKLRLKLQYGKSHLFFSQRKVISKYTVTRKSICRKSIVFIIIFTYWFIKARYRIKFRVI